jgi:hypothetical protein
MCKKQITQLVLQLENYIECWKQFHYYLSLARTKKFDAELEHQFLEVKSVITQELEIILASVECSSPNKSEVHQLMCNAPSIRYVSELPEASLRSLETQWHKAYIGWQSILGQLKVRQRQFDSEPNWKSWFKKE